jgi:hypothetical protein
MTYLTESPLEPESPASTPVDSDERPGCGCGNLETWLNEEDDEDWGPDAPNPYLVEHGLEKAELGLFIAFHSSDDDEIKDLVATALTALGKAIPLNNKKLAADN